jgi:hypothetical protein
MNDIIRFHLFATTLAAHLSALHVYILCSRARHLFTALASTVLISVFINRNKCIRLYCPIFTLLSSSFHIRLANYCGSYFARRASISTFVPVSTTFS